MFVVFGSVTGLRGHTYGPWELLDSASIPLKPPALRFLCRYYKSSTFSQMANMHASPPCWPPMSVAAAWRNRHILTKKWQCPSGRVLPIVQALDSKAFGIHCSGARHTDWVRYGKVVPEFLQGTVSSNTSRLNLLIHIDKHLELLGGLRLTSTLSTAGAAVVAQLVPTLPVPHLDEGSIDTAFEMNLDTPIPLSERKCPRVLPRQALGLHLLWRMYPVMRGNYEKPP